MRTGFVEPPEVTEAGGPHQGQSPEERRIPVLEGDLVRRLEVSAAQAVGPKAEQDVRQAVGIPLPGAPAQGRATLPVAQKREQVANDLEVDEGAGAGAKGLLHLLWRPRALP